MAKRKEKRAKWLHLRISQKEYDILHEWTHQSTCRKSSEFVRDALFQRPIRVFYRSKSADEFLSVALKLKNELSSIGNNFNQAVKRLHTLDNFPEFKSWLIAYEQEKKMLFNTISEIKNYMQKFGEKWLQ